MNLLMEKTEYYLAFTKYLEHLRKHIYTTNIIESNIIESVNSLIEKTRIKTGEYFNSAEALKLIFISREKI
ncbi:transposase, mutator type [Thermoanaerobacter ethanolicus JW 200]|nr:transposase, mutator type [Thermoanaerobacter ethanolicus JW 200]